jgi:hypothetical protein
MSAIEAIPWRRDGEVSRRAAPRWQIATALFAPFVELDDANLASHAGVARRERARPRIFKRIETAPPLQPRDDMKPRRHAKIQPPERRFAFRIKKDDLASELGREVVQKANTGEDQAIDNMNAETEEEFGGPFIESQADDEFDEEPDASNPVESTREPFPTS